MEERKQTIYDHENFVNQALIKAHTIGDLRDESDFQNSKYHAKQSLYFVKGFIENYRGEIHQMREFIERAIEDIEKFKVNT